MDNEEQTSFAGVPPRTVVGTASFAGTMTIGDGLLFNREVRSDGDGIVMVKFDGEAFVLKCWPWSANPNGDDAEQYRG